MKDENLGHKILKKRAGCWEGDCEALRPAFCSFRDGCALRADALKW